MRTTKASKATKATKATKPPKATKASKPPKATKTKPPKAAKATKATKPPKAAKATEAIKASKPTAPSAKSASSAKATFPSILKLKFPERMATRGTTLVVASDQSSSVGLLSTFVPERPLVSFNARASGLGVLPDDRIVISHGAVRVLDLNGRELARIHGKKYEHAGLVRVSADGSEIAVASSAGTSVIWCWKIEDLLASRPPTRTVEIEPQTGWGQFWLDPDGTIVRIQKRSLVSYRPNGTTEHVAIRGLGEDRLGAHEIEGTAEWFLARLDVYGDDIDEEDCTWVIDRGGNVLAKLPRGLAQTAKPLDEKSIVVASGPFKNRIYGGDQRSLLDSIKLPHPSMNKGFIARFDVSSGRMSGLIPCSKGISRSLAVMDRMYVVAGWDACVTIHRVSEF